MRAIILAGGLGTRISEETSDKPKPMVTLNGKPMIWHLMNVLQLGGIDKFVIAAGYKVEVISNWVTELQARWSIDVVDTGLYTQTGGRIKLCMEKYPNERLLATYGDGLANIELAALLKFHENQGRLATVTAVRPPARFGVIEDEQGLVTHFGEKQHASGGWINGGFFILEPQVQQFVHALDEPFETGALPRLVAKRELSAYRHYGFWQPMDTLRERNELEKLSKLDTPPWMMMT
jgi:glucose-1-phosphate cytidylyltransferase